MRQGVDHAPEGSSVYTKALLHPAAAAAVVSGVAATVGIASVLRARAGNGTVIPRYSAREPQDPGAAIP